MTVISILRSKIRQYQRQECRRDEEEFEQIYRRTEQNEYLVFESECARAMDDGHPVFSIAKSSTGRRLTLRVNLPKGVGTCIPDQYYPDDRYMDWREFRLGSSTHRIYDEWNASRRHHGNVNEGIFVRSLNSNNESSALIEAMNIIESWGLIPLIYVADRGVKTIYLSEEARQLDEMCNNWFENVTTPDGLTASERRRQKALEARQIRQDIRGLSRRRELLLNSDAGDASHDRFLESIENSLFVHLSKLLSLSRRQRDYDLIYGYILACRNKISIQQAKTMVKKGWRPKGLGEIIGIIAPVIEHLEKSSDIDDTERLISLAEDLDNSWLLRERGNSLLEAYEQRYLDLSGRAHALMFRAPGTASVKL